MEHYLLVVIEGMPPNLEGPLDEETVVNRAVELFQTTIDPDWDKLILLKVDDAGVPFISEFSEEFIDNAMDTLPDEGEEEV